MWTKIHASHAIESAEMQGSEVGHAPTPSDDRQLAFVEVAEGAPRLTGQVGANGRRRKLPLLDGNGAETGERLSVGVAEGGGIAQDKDVGVVGDRTIRLDQCAPNPVEGSAQRLQQGAGTVAGSPDHCVGRDDEASGGHMVGADVRDERFGPDIHPEPTERLAGAIGQGGGVTRQQLTASLEQDHRRRSRVDPTKIAAEGILPNLGEGTRDFHSRRAAADDDEGEQCAPLFDVRFPLRRFEGQQDAPADILRIVRRLEARRGQFPAVMPEVGVPHPGGDEEIVVLQRMTVGELHPAGGGVDRRSPPP